jgi:hypothetical protein
MYNVSWQRILTYRRYIKILMVAVKGAVSARDGVVAY